MGSMMLLWFGFASLLTVQALRRESRAQPYGQARAITHGTGKGGGLTPLKPWGEKNGRGSNLTKDGRDSNLTKDVEARQCVPANTVFDLGFYDGADSQGYLQAGYCVVGIEADPILVEEANTKFSQGIASGQLRMVNVAIAPSGDGTSWTTFYQNKCTKEWNSFYQSVGCRSCQPPHKVLPPPSAACDAIPVKAVTCHKILTSYGVPHYLKLDIEGAEPGCFEAIAALGQGVQRPGFISAEITEVEYIDHLYNLGYTAFKLQRQDQHHNGAASTSGPWGHNAIDCRTGDKWRTYQEARSEMQAILSKAYDSHDPCPGGVIPLHRNSSTASNSGSQYMWYDVHAAINGGV
eukprot:gnl/TRDRNA2_/TRDRNA2_181697_c0_seq1.p1 gnl/TRDRNA2_/TRDRNA2_181697_c0~~gnl/TRDRNA2_/TRDRNA2_181697_c0_seq1.p1  ORF type:complete len:349 (+),score=51.62 gnl/TRDRNA2_/TRDRNA2_181697_c0_seq1:66-1112(+)